MKIETIEEYTLPNGEVRTGKQILDSIAFVEYMEERFGSNFVQGGSNHE